MRCWWKTQRPRLEMRNTAHTSDLHFHGEILLSWSGNKLALCHKGLSLFFTVTCKHSWKACCSAAVGLFVALWTAAHQTPLSFTISWSLRKLTSVESMKPSNHLILCCSLLLLPSIFPSIRVFSNESALLIRWPKYWSFSFSISLSNKYSGLISFRIDWLDLLVVQGTLNCLL